MVARIRSIHFIGWWANPSVLNDEYRAAITKIFGLCFLNGSSFVVSMLTQVADYLHDKLASIAIIALASYIDR